MRLLPRLPNLISSTSRRMIDRLATRFGVEFPHRAATAGDAVQRVYESRPDLREAFPLGLTPHQREAFAVWLFENGRPDLGLTDDEIIDYLLTAERDASQGLAATWLLSPHWQSKVPNALTRARWCMFKNALASENGIAARWLKTARLPCKYLHKSPAQGVNLLAHFRYPSGLQEEALQYVAALRTHGEAISLRDAPITFNRTPSDEDLLGQESHDITLAKLGACESLDDQYPRTGWHPRPGVYRIACWSWELAMLPPHLTGKADLADEIWTPSAFCADAVRYAFPARTVTAMLPAVSLPPFALKPRAHFGLPSHRRLFLFAFDMGSVMERKNPLGLIDAFRRAFRPDDRVHLAIKVTRGDSRPRDLARLRDAAAGGNITILDRVMPRDEILALMAGADAYVSLHRAEGFGYTMAEAMLLGKPVIATGYSANVEFMTPATALAVEHRLVPVGDGQSPYPAVGFWAEPDRDHAAALMRQVHERYDDALDMGRRARDHIDKMLSPAAAGRRMLDRLTAIRKLRA